MIPVLVKRFLIVRLCAALDFVPNGIQLLERAVFHLPRARRQERFQPPKTRQKPLRSLMQCLAGMLAQETRKVHCNEQEIAQLAPRVIHVALCQGFAYFPHLFLDLVQHPRNIGPIKPALGGCALDFKRLGKGVGAGKRIRHLTSAFRQGTLLPLACTRDHKTYGRAP